MPKFKVTLQKTITTVIEVEAANLIAARRHVHVYGLIEAISDSPVIEETVAARIKSVEAM